MTEGCEGSERLPLSTVHSNCRSVPETPIVRLAVSPVKMVVLGLASISLIGVGGSTFRTHPTISNPMPTRTIFCSIDREIISGLLELHLLYLRFSNDMQTG